MLGAAAEDREAGGRMSMKLWRILAYALLLAAAPCYAGENGKNNNNLTDPVVSFMLPGNYSLGFETTAPNGDSHSDNVADPRKYSLGLDANTLHDESAIDPSGVIAPKRETASRPFLGLKLSKPLSE